MKKSKKGFTLIEMIIVIAIIAVLLLIMVPTMNGFVKTAQNEKDLANARSLYTSAKAQYTAASVHLKDSTGTEYTLPTSDSTSLNADFWDGAFPKDSDGNACTLTVTSATAITVTCGSQTYPQ